MNKISISLSPGSIQNAIDELGKYRKELASKIDSSREAVAEKAKEIYIEESQVAIGSNRAAGNTIVVNQVNSSSIQTTDPVLVYNEFGTGITGKGNPHPKSSLVGWAYDIHGHKDGGWVYPKENGGFGWTTGLPPRRPMQNTSDRLRSGEALKAFIERWNSNG